MNQTIYDAANKALPAIILLMRDEVARRWLEAYSPALYRRFDEAARLIDQWLGGDAAVTIDRECRPSTTEADA